MTKQVILFDNDGVLVETEHWYYKANQRALGELGVTFSLETYLDNMSNGISSWELAREKGFGEADIGQCRRARNHYYQQYLQTENIEIEGVENTLESLSKKYKMAIVTTAKRIDFELIHSNRNIVGFMDFVLTSEDYNNAKPHPEPYLTALDKFGVGAADAVVVEDSARGLKSAVAAGIDCIAVYNQFTRSHDFSTAKVRIKQFGELPKAIADLKSSNL